MDESVVIPDTFHDIVEPLPVSWWPLQAGWWILLGVIGLGLLYWAYRRWQVACANLYRKEALEEIETSESCAAVAGILLRCARVWKTGPQLQAMAPEEWFHFLEETGGRPVPSTLSENWVRSVYGSETQSHLQEWKAFAVEWVKHHQVEHGDD